MPSVGTLVMSMAGDVAQIKRRLQARKAILQGRSANPQLGLLVEEKGEITSLRSPQRIKPLTAFVREKVFKNPPTAMQERAIDVALNTPDIAVIQGPPGTGKTTVIAAILERLNEIATKEGARGQGQVLLSGFQHDAVENMIDRISLNGIPVPKFGKRSGSAVDDLNAFEKNLEEWCGQHRPGAQGEEPSDRRTRRRVRDQRPLQAVPQNPHAQTGDHSRRAASRRSTSPSSARSCHAKPSNLKRRLTAEAVASDGPRPSPCAPHSASELAPRASPTTGRSAPRTPSSTSKTCWTSISRHCSKEQAPGTSIAVLRHSSASSHN